MILPDIRESKAEALRKFISLSEQLETLRQKNNNLSGSQGEQELTAEIKEAELVLHSLEALENYYEIQSATPTELLDEMSSLNHIPY